MLLNIQGVGEVSVNRKRGQKRTTLRISSKGHIKVGTNLTTSPITIKKFVMSNREWLAEQLIKSGLAEPIIIYDGQNVCPNLMFVFKSSPQRDLDESEVKFSYRYSSIRDQQIINIEFPAGGSAENDSLQLDSKQRSQLEPIVIKAIRRQAKDYLPDRIRQLADRTNHQFNKVTIRDTSSRWGSCTASNDINLSLWLMLVPQKLSDYVLIHELSHTKYKNHKAEFWDEVATHLPDYRACRKELKRYHQQIWW